MTIDEFKNKYNSLLELFYKSFIYCYYHNEEGKVVYTYDNKNFIPSIIGIGIEPSLFSTENQKIFCRIEYNQYVSDLNLITPDNLESDNNVIYDFIIVGKLIRIIQTGEIKNFVNIFYSRDKSSYKNFLGITIGECKGDICEIMEDGHHPYVEKSISENPTAVINIANQLIDGSFYECLWYGISYIFLKN